MHPRRDSSLRAIDAQLVQLRYIITSTQRAVDGFERVECVLEEGVVVQKRGDRLTARGMVWSSLKRLAQCRERLRLLAELSKLKGSKSVQKFGLPARIGLEGHAALEHLRQAPRFAKSQEQPVQRRQDLGVVPQSFCRRRIRAGGALRVVELYFAQAPQPDE